MLPMRTVGVLALQGNWRHHINLCHHLSVDCIAVHTLQALAQCHGLIIPGGESTVIARLLAQGRLLEPLQRAVGRQFPIMGCCAGAILLAQRVLPDTPHIETLAAIDMAVQRNAYGRQIHSAVHPITLFNTPQRALFIRAPKIVSVGAAVEVIATTSTDIVGVRNDNYIAVTFHPEETGLATVHRSFVTDCVSTFPHSFADCIV